MKLLLSFYINISTVDILRQENVFFFADYGAEFTSNLQRKLAKDFGVEMRCFSAGRPWGNGQAEAALKKIKKIFIKNSMFCH